MTQTDSINRIIRELALEQWKSAEKLENAFREYDPDVLLPTAEKALRTACSLCLLCRDVIESIYAGLPSEKRTVDIDLVEADAMHISIKALEAFAYPVYRISAPFLLPNKRTPRAVLKNAVTSAVFRVVSNYRKENQIRPLDHATVFFISYSDKEKHAVDNDNQESSIILNGLVHARLLRDDNPSVCNTIYYSKRIDAGARTEIYVVDSIHDAEVFWWIKANLMSQTDFC